jgi:spoIIIJ-associated protein
LDEQKYKLESIGPSIEEFLRPLLKKAGFRLKYEIADPNNPHPEFENPEVLVKFLGPDVELLLNNRAELLLALEHLSMEVLRMPPEDHSRLCFDANDYRALRIEELRLSAVTAAEKVKRTGVPFAFNPMTSRERRIIHLALRTETEVRSESSGMGVHRQVVIYPAGMPSQPQLGPQNPGPARFPRRSRRR